MKEFNTRAFVSLSLTFSTVSLLLSSVILYIAPFGRDAYWVNWSFLFLNKEQWTACHIILVSLCLFLSFGIWP